MNIEFVRARIRTYHRLARLPLGSVRATGWIREQLQRSAAGMGGHLDELEPDMIATPFINYSRLSHVPDVMDEEHTDPSFAAGWSGEVSGTYWLGFVELAFTLGDPELVGKATAWVDGVLAHAEPDGYLGSYPPGTNRLADYNAWSCNWLYRALLSFYEATGREDVLTAVYRGLLWFCENWRDNKTDYAGPTLIESMSVVYAYTGDERLLDFCRNYFSWLEEHSAKPNKPSQLQSDGLSYNSMHVVAYGEDAKLPAVSYCVTGDAEMLRAGVNGIDKAIAKIVQPTGGPSSCCEFLSPIGASAETEYCNFATYQHSYQWLAMAGGEARYGDQIERILFNGAQGARKKDERAIAYMTSPNQMLATRTSSVYVDVPVTPVEAYAPNFQVGCCPAQSVRVIPEFVRGMCLTDREGGLYLLAYGPAEVKTADFKLRIETSYPFEEQVRIRFEKMPPDGRPFYLRRPEWCDNPEVRINGRPGRLVLSDGDFYRLAARPLTGDRLEIDFPMQVGVRTLDDRDNMSKFPLVVSRGPLVYALPIPVKWTAYPGTPITPLPEGWSWFEANPDSDAVGERGGHITDIADCFRIAVDTSLAPEDISVRKTGATGYVWENPPIELDMPAYRARYGYAPYISHSHEPWGSELETEGPAYQVRLVPYGCTNLRVTCFYRRRA